MSAPRNARPNQWRKSRKVGRVLSNIPWNHFLRRDGEDIGPDHKLYPNMRYFHVRLKSNGKWVWIPSR